ncbi:MAG: hypothetical protein J6568_03670 [Snodgrassella sp.]|nr:hypothetical protein [Snodgrassella sp.]
MSAFSQNKPVLTTLRLFHLERERVFAKHLLGKQVNTFNLQRSLSKKGCSYDNAMKEITFNCMKTEFVKGEKLMPTEE